MMEILETISKMVLAGLAIWRLTRTVHAAFDDRYLSDGGHTPGLVQLRQENSGGGRVMDFLFWIGIWMSAQTALWVACGFAGVMLHWLAISGAARFAHWSKRVRATAFRSNFMLAPVASTAPEDCNRSVPPCR